MVYFIKLVINGLSARINLNNKEEFCVDKKFLTPKTYLHESPNIECITYVKKKEIHISLGYLLMFGNLGSIEKVVKSILYGDSMTSQLEIEELLDLDVSCIVDDIRNTFAYLNNLYENNSPDLSVTNPPSPLIYEKIITYVYGHELSHYLDDVFTREIRGKHQMEAYLYTIEYLVLAISVFQDEEAKKIFGFLDFSSQIGSIGVTQKWSEETLADYQSFNYVVDRFCAHENSLLRVDLYIAISIVFWGAKLHEVFRMDHFNNDTIYMAHPPASMRYKILGYIVNKKNLDIDYAKFLRVEWYIFVIVEVLMSKAFDIYIGSVKDE